LKDLKSQSEYLKEEISVHRRSLSDMKEGTGFLHAQLSEDFRANLAVMWEFAQREMNENRNENFFLSREVQKIVNKKVTLEKETIESLEKIAALESVIGVRN
jgi:hypothetical protein